MEEETYYDKLAKVEKDISPFMGMYLPLLAKSIKVDYVQKLNEDSVAAFTASKGWGTGSSWTYRVNTWRTSAQGTLFWSIKTKMFCKPTEAQLSAGNYKQHIPIFRGFAYQAVRALEDLRHQKPNKVKPYKTTEEVTMKNTLKNTADTMLKTNKEAALMATKLSVGKTSNSFVMNKLLGNFPWYAKIFSKKKDFLENPIAKIAAAETVASLVAHFAPDNEKLTYISEAMVQDAIVQATYSSNQLEAMILELQDLVKLPDFLSEKS
jgi:hypothetical protein